MPACPAPSAGALPASDPATTPASSPPGEPNGAGVPGPTTVPMVSGVNGVNGEPRMLRFELHVPGKVSIQGRVAVVAIEAALDEIGRYLVGTMAVPVTPAR